MNISFDLWGTLIQANPEFSKAKLKLFNHYNPKLSLAEINTNFNTIKAEANLLVDTYGIHPNITYIFGQALYKLNIKVPYSGLNKIIGDYQKLFLQHPPTMFKDTSETLEKLRSEGHSIFLISNTVFVRGSTLKYSLYDLGVDKYFKIMTFSDEKGFSKPTQRIFSETCYNLNFHCGDNPITDGACEEIGIQFYQINSNEQTIIDFYEHIQRVSNKEHSTARV